jgi:hypothetical protein
LALLLLEEVRSLDESPLGELSFEAEDDDECSLLVLLGATATGATAIGAGCTITTAGAGAGAVRVVDSMVLSELFSTVSLPAHPTTTLPKSTAIPKDIAAAFSVFFMFYSV